MESTLHDLALRIKRVESGLNDIPEFQLPPTDDDYRVDPVRNIAVTSVIISAGLTNVTITWISVEDPRVARYEIWVSRLSNAADKPYLVASVTDSPATFNLTSDAAGYAVAFIRTVMKNGIIIPFSASPSIPFEVF